jgi:prevent-host-death family protein
VKTVNIHDAKTHLSRLVDEVAAGGEVIIARNGKPVARLLPIPARTHPRRPGQWRGQVTIAPDFDAPLPADIAAAFGLDR